jgi:hypothetical protein
VGRYGCPRRRSSMRAVYFAFDIEFAWGVLTRGTVPPTFAGRDGLRDLEKT